MQILVNGDAKTFQARFTASFQEHLVLFCVLRHKEKVYQALCFMLIFLLFNDGYKVKMEEEEDGLGRSDITAHPQSLPFLISLIFEIKAVSTHRKRGKQRIVKSIDNLKKNLERAAAAALQQIEQRQYRAKAPLHTTQLHEYGIAFAGKFCVMAVRTFQREAGTDCWKEVGHQKVVIPEEIPESDLVGGDESGDDDNDNEGMSVDENIAGI